MATLTIIFIIVAFVALVVWTVPEHKPALKSGCLGWGWRKASDYRRYMERRHYKKRKRERLRISDMLRLS